MVHGFRPLPCYRLAWPERRVVRHRGSLTRLLRAFSRESVRVQVIRETLACPDTSEALALGIDPKQRAWVREVYLRGDERLWVKARTVISVHSLRGPTKRIRQLGNRPLGTALFGPRRWRRSRFQCGLIDTDGYHQVLLARRSRFQRGCHSLLVTECFLPDLWHDIRDQPMRSHPIHADHVRPL